MALGVCSGYELKNFESLLGTAVGVGFIFPVVYQLLVERANQLLNKSRILLEELESQNNRTATRDVAALRIKFQIFLSRMDRVAHTLILISSISALISFAASIYSAFAPLCMQPLVATLLIATVSAPVLFCTVTFISWWDSSRPLISRCDHYYNE